MHSIFLVEDEIATREGMKNNVSWEKEGFRIVGDESDGELAYPMIVKEQPDILITDIKMPFMDGLELSKIVKKEMPNIKIIIVSGYSDFSYAQEAIDIGVSEYLLKPVTSQKLIRAVKNVASSIEQEKENQRILEEYSKYEFQQHSEKRNHFFQMLVSGKLSLLKILDEEKELGINMVASVFRVFLFQMNTNNDAFEYSDELVKMEEAISNLASRNEKLEAFRRDNDGWAFVLMGETEDDLDKQTEGLKKELVRIVGKEVTYFGGVGRTVYRVRDVKQSYLDANRAFSMRFFSEQNQILTYNDLQHVQKVDRQINVRDLNVEKLDSNRIDNFLKNGMIQDVNDFVESYLYEIGTNAMNSLLFRQYILLDSYFSVVKFLKQLNYETDEIETISKMIHCEEATSVNFESCVSIFKEMLEKAIELRNFSSSQKYAGLTKKAKEYMKQHYMDGELSLNTVASYVNVSPNYFSSLFNQEENMTFIEYLTKIRIEKAKEYLRCTNKKITEIGYDVGYQDSHYFSFVFKKVQDCTPKEYRNKGTL